MDADNNFLWTDCYMELADKILSFKADRKSLLTLLQIVFEEVGMKVAYMEDDKVMEDICPFTVLNLKNR